MCGFGVVRDAKLTVYFNCHFGVSIHSGVCTERGGHAPNFDEPLDCRSLRVLLTTKHMRCLLFTEKMSHY